jgi:flagellar basal-body rod protein FlgB
METGHLNVLRSAMKTYAMRTHSIASNIANADTPGYQRVSVSFEDQLRDARHQVPSMRDGTDVEPSMEVEDGPPILEDELMNLADTQMRTQLVTRALRDHFELMQTGIKGRSQ